MSKIIIIAGPSGAGKGTIEKELFKDESLSLAFSVSATTRNPRPGEIDKEHYYFLKKDEFKKLIDKNRFIEWSNHLNNYYGTLISEVESKLNEGFNVLVEVDTTGALNIIEKYTKENKIEELITIFIMPPSIEELEKRILNRKSENDKSLKVRLAKAQEEMELSKNFMYCVINDKINLSTKKIKEIIKNLI